MIAKLVYDAVVRLYDSGYAIVGTAKEIDGKVLVVPWDGTRHEVLSRLDRFMTTAGDSPVQDDLNVFWLERTSLL